GDMGEEAVEHPCAGLIAVEALGKMVAQVASRLRDAESQRVRHRATKQFAAGCFLAQMADQVARRGKADAEDSRLRCSIAQFVDRTRLGSCAVCQAHRARVDELELGGSPFG